MSRLHRFLQADRCTQRLIVRGVVLVITIRLALWMLPYRWIREGLLLCPARLHEYNEAVDIRQVVRVVRSASRLVPRATCLTQALATRILLARMGVPSDLRLGVARNSETCSFEAHAWVECEGRTIIGGTLPGRYVPLPQQGSGVR